MGERGVLAQKKRKNPWGEAHLVKGQNAKKEKKSIDYVIRRGFEGKGDRISIVGEGGLWIRGERKLEKRNVKKG